MSSEQRTYGAHYYASCKGKKVRRGSHHFQTGKYKKQWQRTTANKKRKLKKHLSLQPKDIQALKALKLMLQ